LRLRIKFLTTLKLTRKRDDAMDTQMGAYLVFSTL